MTSRAIGPLALAALAVTGMVACSGGDRASDPSKPAVVQAPPVVLPSDTAKPDTMQDHRDRMAVVARELGEPYALIGFGTVRGDRRLLSAYYGPDAELVLADSGFKGMVKVVDALVALGRRTGLVDWSRQSRTVSSFPDSIYVDSGYYLMHARRQGGGTSQSVGEYVAKWRHVGGPTPWVLLHDEIVPAKPRRR